ncbi:amidohydrolase family protein [Sphingobacterium daejeonense]|uniref:amidohydrolase family protein n=1 Tax=Sphingobacterium daejeonense TaxID=371142 RepID=UPI0010C398FA|nr:amidohydrolase family protein [Sphingobacterium daejeonense]VTQ03700.1 Imidazolonepropionase [Sphingobacterium daejeonense]
MKETGKLIGPFKQLLTMQHLPLKGALKDSDLEIIANAGIFIQDGKISVVGDFQGLREALGNDVEIIELNGDFVAMPGFIDCHTHIAFGGSRANDFAMRNAGSSYLEIAEAGGGIWSTVQHTRACSQEELKELTLKRADALLRQGITTVEVKSGYGLKVEEELKTLGAIKEANKSTYVDLIPTCLAAHMHPKTTRELPKIICMKWEKNYFQS